jgi:hypothetical protein
VHLLKLLHYLLLIFVEGSNFQNWILRTLSLPELNFFNPLDNILGIVGRDEKISQVKKIMEIQGKNETRLQVRGGN